MHCIAKPDLKSWKKAMTLDGKAKEEFESSLVASELALGKSGNHLKVIKFGWLSESTSFILPDARER